MAGDDQDQAEAFDADKLDDDRDEAVGQLGFPPERLLGADDPTADDLVTDSVASRHDREEPDPLDEIDTRRSSDVDDAAEADQTFGEGSPGRLVEPGADDDGELAADLESQAIARAVPDGDDLTAEEAAIHFENG